jgi:hypothetical protein
MRRTLPPFRLCETRPDSAAALALTVAAIAAATLDFTKFLRSVAAALRVSVATVEHDLALVRAWVAGQLGGRDR